MRRRKLAEKDPTRQTLVAKGVDITTAILDWFSVLSITTSCVNHVDSQKLTPVWQYYLPPPPHTHTHSSGSSSNSSSDGASDDEYFDAEGGFKNEPLSSEVLMSPSVSVHPAEADPSDVEEEGQEKETNDVSDGVAANRSIIMHMISQVRVGMDLTKIVLPTFILEKRSLLEMYADFLAHPDIFAT